MKLRLNFLAALLPAVFFLLTGCAAVGTTAHVTSASANAQARQDSPDSGNLSEREKWSMARDAFSRAQHEQSGKNNEAAAYYYEVALELLGSLDMGAIEIPTQRVLTFQKKVLKSYDQFLASVDNLPSTTGPMAVREATVPRGTAADDGLPEKAPVKESKPVVARPGAPMLPDVPHDMNGRVADQINFFMGRGHKVMLAWMERSRRIFPRLRPILAEEGIPEDVLYLAMIESGLNPRACSYAHASGIWQFIPGTGRIYGLNIDRIYDERMHIEASTRAACHYLRKLHDEFDDWFLAFAAYNCGEMRIEREANRGHGRDYWSLNRLPRQTRGYVPEYLATRAIMENPTQYGFPPLGPEIPFECETVLLDGSYRLEHIAQAAGVDPNDVLDLNPEFVRGVTPPATKTMVRLPRHADKAFEARLATLPQAQVKPTQLHKVRSGETLAGVARKYGTTVSEIRALPENRGVKSGRLRVGQEIVIPAPQVAEAARPKSVAPKAKDDQPEVTQKVAPESPANADTNGDHEIVYTVHRGETLGRIGSQLGISVAELCRQNGIDDPNLIKPGTKLRVRINNPASPAPEAMADKSETKADSTANAAPHTHTVQAGETIWSIARTYGQDPMKILSWNRLEPDTTIYPGQRLIVSQE